MKRIVNIDRSLDGNQYIVCLYDQHFAEYNDLTIGFDSYDEAYEWAKKIKDVAISQGGNMIECEDCGELWTEQELNSYAWHCLKCGHKIGD